MQLSRKLKNLFAAISATILFSCGPTPAPAMSLTQQDQSAQTTESLEVCKEATEVLVRLQPYLIDPTILKASIEAVKSTKDAPPEVKDWFEKQINLGAHMQNPKIYGKLVFTSCVNEMKQPKGTQNEL